MVIMSERKLASIQKITEILPIDGADKIVCVKILGWQCVALKTEFKVNDACVFFEIDSVLPIAQWNDHLRKEPNKPLRIKTIRLRGQLSQGLAMPMSIIPTGEYEVGQDVTELVGVTKYEPVVPAHLSGMAKGNFPAFLHKTDETRLQSEPRVLDEAISKGLVLVGTLKMDGTSFTAYRRDDEFGVCSRNLDLKETEDNAHWRMARKLKLEEILRSEPSNLSIQGEIVGPSIQANRLGLSESKLYLFNLFDIDTGKYLSHTELSAFAEKHGLKVVPTVYRLDFGGVVGPRDVNHLLNIANNLNYDNGTPAEGIVWRSMCETHSDVLKGRLSFKTISNRYLEKYKE
jgi:RNA ligase (TIGR02306 family)